MFAGIGHCYVYTDIAGVLRNTQRSSSMFQPGPTFSLCYEILTYNSIASLH